MVKPIIDLDNSLIIFELLEDGWPNKHIDVLKNIGLIGSLNSPFVLLDRKLSLSKWSKKIERVMNLFLKKIDTDNLMNSLINKDDNKIDQIKNIFKYSNLVFLYALSHSYLATCFAIDLKIQGYEERYIGLSLSLWYF